MLEQVLEGVAVGVLIVDGEGRERHRTARVASAVAGTALSEPGRFNRRVQSLAQRCQSAGVPEAECFEATAEGACGVRLTAAPIPAGGAVLTFEPLRASDDVDARVRQFVAHLTHDLRTPLTSILGASDLLLSGRIGTPDERHARLLQIVGEGTQRMASLLSELTARFVEPEVRT